MNPGSYLKKLITERRQFIYYCLIGGLGASLDFLTFTMLLKQAGATHYQLANAAGYAVGTLWSFTANARLNFKTQNRLAGRFLAFCSIAFLGWLVSAGLLHLLAGEMGLNKYLSKLATLVVVVFLQYNLNRCYSFRKTN